MKPELINSSYKMVWSENFKTMKDYNQLLNWTNFEFLLYQRQEEPSSLKVFFPNGWFFMNLIEEKGVDIEIVVKSKCKKTMVKIYNHLNALVNHFKNYKAII